MANTIKIDPRLLVSWTTGTQYRIVVTEGLVKEVGNNRTSSPFTSSTFSTFENGPTVVSTFPINNTATSFVSTATLNYNRPLFSTTSTQNFYLYQENGATDILVATIPTTSTRVTQVGKTVNVSFKDLLVPERTYYLTADANVYTDLFKLASPAITNDTIFKYTPGPAADIVSITPSYGQENTFVNSATITYNRDLTVQTGNYYLNSTATGVIRTFDITSLDLELANNPNTILQLRLENNFNDDVKGVTTATNTGVAWSNNSKYGSFSLNFGSDAIQSNNVAFSSTNLLLNSDYTIEAWILPPLTASQPPFFYHPIISNSELTVSLMFSDSGNSGNYELFFKDDVNQFYIATPGNQAIIANQWNHVFLQRSGNTTTMGVNGQVYSMNHYNRNIDFRSFKIGGAGSRGLIDSIKISNVARYPTNGSYTQPSGEFITPLRTVKLDFADLNLPEGEYFITNDQGVFKDNYNFPILEVDDNSEIKWFNTSISNMITRKYRGEQPTAIFTSTVPQVLDISIDTSTQYTFTLESPIGEFSSPLGGTDEGSYWSFTGTKAQINNLISSIIFTTYAQSNPDSTYTYSLSKNGITLVEKTKELEGILLLLGAPGPTGKAFPRLQLNVQGTKSTDEPLNLSASISTNTNLTGNIVFKADNVEIATVAITTGNAVSTVTTFNTTGSRFISAHWLAGQLGDGYFYEPLDSFDTRVFIDTASQFPGEIQLSALGLGSNRLPIGPSVSLLAQLTQNSTASSTVSFLEIVPTNTTTTYTSATNINITSNGPRWIQVDNISTIKLGDWLKIGGTMTSVGYISSNYRVSLINGNRIDFNARSEDDNEYYGYDPLLESQKSGITVTFDPIVYDAIYTKQDIARTTSTLLTTASIVNNSATYTTSFSTTGTKYIVADWSGTSTFPKYFPESSGLIEFEITERADYGGTLVLSLGTGTVNQLDGTTNRIQLSTPEPTTGTITLSMVSTLGSQNTSTVQIVNTTTTIVDRSTETTVLSFVPDYGNFTYELLYEGVISASTSTARSTTTNVSTTSQTIDFYSTSGYVVRNITNTATTTISSTATTVNAIEKVAAASDGRPYVYASGIFSGGGSQRYSDPVTFLQKLSSNSFRIQAYTVDEFVVIDEGKAWVWAVRNGTTQYPSSGAPISTADLLGVYDASTGVSLGYFTPSMNANTIYLGQSAYMRRQSITTSTVRTITTASVIRTITDTNQVIEQTQYTSTFTNGNITIDIPPGTFNTTATVLGKNLLQAEWDGQTYTAEFYPYYGLTSNTATQFVKPVELIISGNTFTNDISVNTLTISLNNSNSIAGSLSVYKGDVKLASTQTNSNTATVVIPSTLLSSGENTLTASWDVGYPLTTSNNFISKKLDYVSPAILTTVTSVSYQLYDNSNSTITNQVVVPVRLVVNGALTNTNIVGLPTGDTAILNINSFGIGSTSVQVFADVSSLSAGQAITINNQAGYTITNIIPDGGSYNTIQFTPSYKGILNGYPPVVFDFYPTATLQLIDPTVGVLSTGTLNQNLETTLSWVPSEKGQPLGSRNLQILYTGDQWYNTGTQTISFNLFKRSSPAITLSATSNYLFRVGSTTTFAVTKPDGVTFAENVWFFSTATTTAIGQASFVGNTATFQTNTLTEGTYTVQAVYPEDDYATSTSSNSVSITLTKTLFGGLGSPTFALTPGATNTVTTVSKASNSIVYIRFRFAYNTDVANAGIPFPSGNMFFVRNSVTTIGNVSLSSATLVSGTTNQYDLEFAYNISSIPANTYNFSTSYPGDAYWTSAISLTRSLTITA